MDYVKISMDKDIKVIAKMKGKDIKGIAKMKNKYLTIG